MNVQVHPARVDQTGSMDRTPTRKTASMRLVEMQYGQPLEKLLPELLDKWQTVEGIADELGIGYSTIWRWLVQFGISTRYMEEKEQHRQERERRRADRPN